MAAEELGADGAYFRVHHFARQLASPFPLLAAVGARTSRIEIGTGVIDMRYENPLYMAEDAGAADLIAGRPAAARDQPRVTGAGRSTGSATSATTRPRAPTTRTWRASTREVFLERHQGRGLRRAEPAADVPEPARAAAARAALARPARADLVGRRHPAPRPSGPPSRA